MAVQTEHPAVMMERLLQEKHNLILDNERLFAEKTDLLKAAVMLDSLETRMDHGDEEASADWPHAMTSLRAAIARARG